MIIDFKKQPDYCLHAEALLNTYPEVFSKESINISDNNAEFVRNIFGLWKSYINIEILSYDLRMGEELDYVMYEFELDDTSINEVVRRVFPPIKSQSTIQCDKYIIGKVLKVIDDIILESCV